MIPKHTFKFLPIAAKLSTCEQSSCFLQQLINLFMKASIFLPDYARNLWRPGVQRENCSFISQFIFVCNWLHHSWDSSALNTFPASLIFSSCQNSFPSEEGKAVTSASHAVFLFFCSGMFTKTLFSQQQTAQTAVKFLACNLHYAIPIGNVGSWIWFWVQWWISGRVSDRVQGSKQPACLRFPRTYSWLVKAW